MFSFDYMSSACKTRCAARGGVNILTADPNYISCPDLPYSDAVSSYILHIHLPLHRTKNYRICFSISRCPPTRLTLLARLMRVVPTRTQTRSQSERTKTRLQPRRRPVIVAESGKAETRIIRLPRRLAYPVVLPPLRDGFTHRAMESPSGFHRRQRSRMILAKPNSHRRSVNRGENCFRIACWRIHLQICLLVSTE
jgi:hypothetical protein